MHDGSVGGGVGGDPLVLHLPENAPHGGDPAGLPEDVEHSGVGEAVVLEAGEAGGPVEEEPGLFHRRVGLEDAVDCEGVPAEGKGTELSGGGVPRRVTEGGGDLVDGGAHILRQRGIRKGLLGERGRPLLGAAEAERGEGSAMGSRRWHSLNRDKAAA